MTLTLTLTLTLTITITLTLTLSLTLILQTVLTCYADQSASSSCGVAMLCAKARVRP